MLPQQAVERLLTWAREEGVATPVFLLSKASLRAGVATLRDALPGRISYATKANAHPLVLAELTGLVDEFNVTNLVHLDALLDLGVAPSRVMFVHPVVTPATAARVAERGVTRFVVDDQRGLDVVRGLGREFRVTLRLLPPDTGESTHSVVRFGNTRDALLDVARKAVDAGLEIEALSFFVGTSGADMAQAMPFRRGLDALATLYDDLQRDDIKVGTVDIGGGFPGSRSDFYRQHPGYFSVIARAITERFGSAIEILSEPGRYLSEPSMAMLTAVIADRSSAGRRLVHVDASAYGGLFEHSFIEKGGPGLGIATSPSEDPVTAADVLGPIMDSFDVIKRSARLPRLREGQLLLLPNTGAYAWSYTARCEGLAEPEVIAVPGDIDASLAQAWYG